MATKKPLTLKQQRFVDALPLANSLTDAAIKAGYGSGVNENAAHVMAYDNLRKPTVLAAIAEQRDAAKFAAALSVVERKERLSRLAQPDPEHPDPVAAIKELNRMESIGIVKSVNVNVNLDLQAELTQTFSVDELKALLGKMGA